MTERYGMVIGLAPGQEEEYLRLHRSVWPQVEATLTAHGIRNYTIFRRAELLFAYYEYVGQDHDADLARIAQDPVTQKWWELTDPCQQRLPDAQPGEQWSRLEPVWHLD